MRKSTALILLTTVSFLTEEGCTLCFAAADAADPGVFTAAASGASLHPSHRDIHPQQINSNEQRQGDTEEDQGSDDDHANGENQPRRDDDQENDEDRDQRDDQTQARAIARAQPLWRRTLGGACSHS